MEITNEQINKAFENLSDEWQEAIFDVGVDKKINEITEKYKLQLDSANTVYMETNYVILGLKKAVLVYVLLDSPENLPAWETPKTYSHLDKKYRIKKYDVEYSEDVIADLKQRVTNIREFIKTINYE